MTEALITELGKLGGLRVISRTSVMPYRDAAVLVREIAADLGVEAIIEGSVLRAGERVRITVQLIDARSDTHLWAESYERDLSDILGVDSPYEPLYDDPRFTDLLNRIGLPWDSA